jgi:CRISPR-associated protein Csx17
MSDFNSTPVSARGAIVDVRWQALALPGLTPDVLGNHLASLGLLALASSRWTDVRGCWRNEQFVLINGPADVASLVDFLGDVVKRRAWSGYGRPWYKTQTADTSNETAASTSQWRSQRATEQELGLFHAHLGLGERLSFNPLLGHGGSTGHRSFSAGWLEATTALAKPNRDWTKQRLAEDLESFLCGKPCRCLGKFNAGSWFSSANKAYNSGTAKSFREGQVTPWAMALACEALPLLQGSTSRQLGAHRRATGAFPFVTKAAAPERAGEAGRSLGELWLPVWQRPMSLVEITTLFSRGRAEVRGRGAVTAPAFSAAILQRGVDAGIDEFCRFILFHTTSEETFESRLASVVPVKVSSDGDLANAVEVALGTRDSLPPDRKKGGRWIYAGLRGPVDRSLIELAARPDAETARALVDALVTALRGVDRNRNHRKRGVRFQLLPGAWAESLIGEQEPVTPEIRLAFALASLRPTLLPPPSRPKQVTAPLLAYWLGAEENRGNWWKFSEAVPLRRVWGGGSFTTNVAAVLQRRLVEERPNSAPPFDARACVGLADIEALFASALDEPELTRWLLRFSLFSPEGASVAGCNRELASGRRTEVLSPALALFALFKPLFDGSLIQSEGVGAFRAARVGTLSRIAALLDRGDINAAVQSARHAYHAVGVEVADFECPFDLSDSGRLLAALLVPVRGAEVAQAFRRWRLPGRVNQRKET